MIVGAITATREAVIRIHLLGSGGHTLDVDAVLDTGFNHDLTLPAALVQSLDLPFVGVAEATLAAEVLVPAKYYRAQLVWDGQLRLIDVLEMEGVPLLGMRLLHGHRVTFDVYSGGPVKIEAF